ncbi:DNA-3-methyladenine glycosylase [Rufibacter glacialis]|uniref:DNA-3-methyladenine glycosylase II n=1 Tax=Rufibacter glacialis TaxID=1259555 RepID=A0A5M8QHX3_9BACT|nr:DNA-3-methyladenine glycosylase [Rufibacter glacialis]KAA6434423.1 DNA-3-methyladenine glycosylase 2 family protein [Rufibacter glacialis]GGK69436.1 DNA-3-methyladenine glycosylase [Rufibacter glacialis]
MGNSHAALFTRDPKLHLLVQQADSLTENGAPKPIYEALLSSVISQQLSVKAAATIKARFMPLFPENYPDPALVLATPQEQLRAVGLSWQKIGYLQNLAQHKASGHLEDTELAHLPDEELISRLTLIKGIGRWTAEMILMFALDRPDVMPVDDLGIYNAMKRLHGFSETGKAAKSRMLELSQAWRPHRTLACRYLWQSLNNAPLKSAEG